MDNAAFAEGETKSRTDEHSSGVSWGAVIGGAFVAASVALIMLALGAGFGLSTVSPWSNASASSAAIGTAAICWLIVIQVISCALGGYLAGRLRTKWVAVHTDEVFFRDTANGFLVWAVGLVITVIFLVSAAATMVGEAAQGRDEGIAAAKTAAGPDSYFVDSLFRSDTVTSASDASIKAEAARIFMHSLRQPDANPADIAYLSKLVTAKAGLSQPDAEHRVSQVLSDARQTEDAAWKTAARLLLWIFLALFDRRLLRQLCRHHRGSATRSRKGFVADESSLRRPYAFDPALFYRCSNPIDHFDRPLYASLLDGFSWEQTRYDGHVNGSIVKRLSRSCQLASAIRSVLRISLECFSLLFVSTILARDTDRPTVVVKLSVGIAIDTFRHRRPAA